MQKWIEDKFAGFLARLMERFPRDLPEDVIDWYSGERTAELTTAIRFGLTEHRKKVHAAERVAEEERRVKNRVLLAQVAEPVAGMEIDFGDGWYFTIEEVVEYEVGFALTTTEILKLMGCARADWKDLGTAPKVGPRMVKPVIGHFNQRWTENGIVALIAQAGCRFKGSGAWVREGFIKFRPKHDGKGWICFVGDPNSHWRFVHDDDVFFPCLYGGDADGWRRGLSRVDDVWGAGDRLCFVWE